MKNSRNIEASKGRFHRSVLGHLGSGALATLIGFGMQTFTHAPVAVGLYITGTGAYWCFRGFNDDQI
jgi:hypothetical protein